MMDCKIVVNPKEVEKFNIKIRLSKERTVAYNLDKGEDLLIMAIKELVKILDGNWDSYFYTLYHRVGQSGEMYKLNNDIYVNEKIYETKLLENFRNQIDKFIIDNNLQESKEDGKRKKFNNKEFQSILNQFLRIRFANDIQKMHYEFIKDELLKDIHDYYCIHKKEEYY